MRLEPTRIAGVWVVQAERRCDERGYFATVWDELEAGGAGLRMTVRQSAFAWNARRGTVRGLHYQVSPHAQAKLVSCQRGELLDVVVDLRSGSPTRGQWVGVHLDADPLRAIYVPEGCAHGYQTLQDETLVAYQLGARHHPELARGLRWDDPALGIEWPLEVASISLQDQGWAPFDPGQEGT